MSNLKIKKLIVGQLSTNCYILEKENQALIIDPGADFDYIKNNLESDLIGVIITHNHFDHVGALEEILEYYNVKKYDIKNLTSINKINIFEFETIKTPGHTSDSITIVFKEEKVMFTGDFIFKGTIGRTDLPTGNIGDMQQSIEEIKKIKENYKIYPGHGEETDLNTEKISNYFF